MADMGLQPRVSRTRKFCPFCCPCRSPTWSPRRSTFAPPMHHPVAYPTHPVHPGPRGTDVRFASGLVAVVLGCVSVVIPLSSLSSQSGSGSWFLGVSRRIVCSQSTSRSKSGSLSVVLGHTPQNQSQDKDKDKDTRAGAWGGGTRGEGGELRARGVGGRGVARGERRRDTNRKQHTDGEGSGVCGVCVVCVFVFGGEQGTRRGAWEGRALGVCKWRGGGTTDLGVSEHQTHPGNRPHHHQRPPAPTAVRCGGGGCT